MKDGVSDLGSVDALLLLGDRTAEISITREQYLDVLHAALSGAPPEVTAAKLAHWTLSSVETSLQRLGEHASALAAKLGKEVDVSVDGGGIGLDGERWSGFWASLVHAVRNAVGHGLETPEERLRGGKGASGTLRLRAALEQRNFVVELEDDGRGIAWSKVADRLRERGLAADTTEALLEGLFADGLSTAESVTDLAGRGVGVGALRAMVRELDGSVSVHSTLNGGTTLRCTFPASSAMVEPAWVLKREMARFASCNPSLRREAGKGSVQRAA